MGLAEVLVAGAVGGVIIAGSMKSLSLSLQSAQVARSSFSESNLRHALSQVLSHEEDCKANLKPTGASLPTPNNAIGLYGDNREKGRGETVQLIKNAGTPDTADDTVLLEKGVAFGGDLNIVKMELKGSTATGDANDPKKRLVTRTFVVYYKKENMGSFSTLAGEPCQAKAGATAENLAGCYFLQGTIAYQLEDKASNPKVISCSAMDFGSGSQTTCYKVDAGAAPNIIKTYHANNQPNHLWHRAYIEDVSRHNRGRTLIGCGVSKDVTEVQASTTTAFGFEAGINTSTSDNAIIITSQKDKFTTANRPNMRKNMAGLFNTFMGYQAGKANTQGMSNTFIGSFAGLDNTGGILSNNERSTGSHNTFVGVRAGRANTTGYHNTFIGNGTGVGNKTGKWNTYIGSQSGGHTHVPDGAGEKNTAIGARAGHYLKTGNYNTFVGWRAGYGIEAGDKNIYIGSNLGRSEDTEKTEVGPSKEDSEAGSTTVVQNNKKGSHNILIGNLSEQKSKELISENANYLWIQDLIEGNSQEQWVAINNNLEAENLYAMLQSSSDKRLKKDLVRLESALEKVNKLQAYSFKWRDSRLRGNDGVYFGFVAQEAQKVIPEVVEKDRKGFFTIRYTEVIPLLVSAFQEFQKSITKQLQDFKEDISLLKKSMEGFQEKMTSLFKEVSKQVQNLNKSIEKLKTNMNKQDKATTHFKNQLEQQNQNIITLQEALKTESQKRKEQNKDIAQLKKRLNQLEK